MAGILNDTREVGHGTTSARAAGPGTWDLILLGAPDTQSRVPPLSPSPSRVPYAVPADSCAANSSDPNLTTRLRPDSLAVYSASSAALMRASRCGISGSGQA